MIIDIQRISPLFSAYDKNRESIRDAVAKAVAESAAKMGPQAAGLFSLNDRRLTIGQRKAA